MAKKIKVNFIFRKRGKGHNSIEELFTSIINNLPKEVEPNIVELPYGGASLKAIVLNLWHVLFLKEIVHITGDVHYVAIRPFKKTILTIHDIGSILKGSYVKKLLLKILWFWLPSLFVKNITVISEFSKKEVLKVIPWAKKKISVIYNPVNPMLETKLKLNFPVKPTILHIGTSANKNLENTLKALTGIPCKLVIVGKLNESQKEGLLASGLVYENYYNISFEEIKQLYEASDIVSFISHYEGFGMPIIEAQRVGRVVITSKAASIPEIAGEGAYFVDNNDIRDMAVGFQELIKKPELRTYLISKGLENVERFKMDAISNQYAVLYKSLS